ncbi:MAG: hypothetical protein MUE37_14315, partial [Bacteroidales bacterium]|nr:hypothetical protein [Bacteroidales bacterium]
MRSLSLLHILILSFGISLSSVAQNDEQVLLKHFHAISSEEISEWMTEICSPRYNGRLAGTPEYIASAQWVA